MGANGLGLGVQGLEVKASILKGPFSYDLMFRFQGLGFKVQILGMLGLSVLSVVKGQLHSDVWGSKVEGRMRNQMKRPWHMEWTFWIDPNEDRGF